MTTVSGSGASTFVACVRNGASTPVAPSAYLMIVLPVQAASSAVRGWPSDHLPGLTLNVHTRPSGEVSQLLAQSPSILKSSSYCTSTGYVLVKVTYDCALKATNGFIES